MRIVRSPGLTVAIVLSELLQMVPTGYVVASGTVPPWCRWSLGAAVAIWFVGTIVKSARA